jgi:hypothetical protein
METLTDALILIDLLYICLQDNPKSLQITSYSRIKNQESIKPLILFLFELLYLIL